MLTGRPGIYLALVALIIAGIISAIGTGGGGDDIPTTVDTSGGGWIKITYPGEEDSYSTDTSPQYFRGEAFISESSGCCSGTAFDTGVTVSWHNEATGESAAANQYVRYCLFLFRIYVCDHTWSARIPVIEGNNPVSVTASGAEGSATKTVTIVRSTDIVPPFVVSTYPEDGATGVEYTTNLAANFNESIVPETVNQNTFLVSSYAGDPIAGWISVSEGGDMATFQPTTALLLNANYTATLTTAITDLSGKSMNEDYVWSFQTGEGDTIAPTILSVQPQDGSTNVSLHASLKASFSEPMQSTTITTDSFLLYDATSNRVSGTVMPSGDSSTFTPSSPMAQNSLYTARITTDVTDLAGNHMENEYAWSFTTTIPDTTPPIVTNTSPSANETGVAIDRELVVEFSEAMNVTTINTSTFILQDSQGNPFSGEIIDGDTFRPYANLALAETYTATITTGVTDLAGNPMAQPYSWSFTTTADGIGAWQATTTFHAPSPREDATAVWTGQEMIVWGGWDGSRLDDGARYNPATDSWQAISRINAPGACSTPVSVWTGQEMIVWCGRIISGSRGARYNPATDSWTPMSVLNAPVGVNETTAVWTGTEMIVWGGYGSTYTNAGGRYNPATDTWQPTTLTNAPERRVYHTAVWTGDEMLVWGGDGGPYVFIGDTGGGYDPATDSWRDVAASGYLNNKVGHVASWTGSDMIVWHGNTNSGRYRPGAGNWNLIASLNALVTRFFPFSEWTGTQMIVWGGEGLNSGGSYDPLTDGWSLMTFSGAPSGRSDGVSVWTGTEFTIWGGRERSGALTNTGGRYRFP